MSIRLVPHSGLVSKLQTFVLKPSPYICTELSVVKNLNTDQPARTLAYSDRVHHGSTNPYILQAMTLLVTLLLTAALKGHFILSYDQMFSTELVFISDKSPR